MRLTGAKYQEEVDFVGDGPAPLRLVRHYLSTGFIEPYAGPSSRLLPLGYHWMHGYERYLAITNSVGANHTVVIRRPGPSPLYFYFNGTTYAPGVDSRARLFRRLDSGGNQLGWRLVNSDATVEHFDMQGQLIELRDRDNLRATLQYDAAGRLSTVSDPFGRTLTFGYDSFSQLTSVTLPNGTQVLYTLERFHQTAMTGLAPTDTGAEIVNRVNITSATYPGGGVRAYHYAEPTLAPTDPMTVFGGLLTGITDETVTRYANYKYEGFPGSYTRVTTEWAGGVNRHEVVPGEFNGNVVRPLGTRISTSNTFVLGAPRLSSMSRCDAANTVCASIAQYTYTANGNVESYTDARGNVTQYAYDTARNLETRRTEAVGTAAARTILTTWNASWPLPAEIQEYSGGVNASGVPTGTLLKRTVYTYDASGNLTQRDEIDTSAAPTTRTWKWTYTTFGRVLTETDPNNRVTTNTYHSDTDPTVGRRGNLATVTNPSNHLTQFTAYDGNARPTTVIDPNGVTTTLTYHPRGWLATSAVSDGSTTRTTTLTYFANGRLQRITQPNGSYLQMGYDAARRLTSVTDNLGNSVTYTLDNVGNRTDEQFRDTSNTLKQRVTRVFDTLDRLQTVTGALQ